MALDGNEEDRYYEDAYWARYTAKGVEISVKPMDARTVPLEMVDTGAKTR
jgi:hypothetical protein